MGFDNECILNIQSLAGEYFCPVCRLLVYPNEALQSQCTHLYCKPCLTYVVSTTRACPYDGYLVTEADSKPLVESNKPLAETIGKVSVHCLYHRSGCTWQGPLSECTSHCSGCAFGDSPVVCNRCGIQIVHRQVQEHAQNCPGVQPQIQQVENAQDTAATGMVAAVNQSQNAPQKGLTTSQAQTSQTTSTVAPAQDAQGNSNTQAQAVVQTAVPTAEQWYQQYYQQYPGYDPYQQYQQYYPYQQQAVPQYQQPPLQAHPLQQQPQAYVQPQAQPQHQTQQPQPQQHVQAPVAVQPQNQGQINPQQQLHPSVQPHSQIQSQTQLPHGHPQPQSYPQPQLHPQTHPMQPHPQYQQIPQYQQPHAQVQHVQPQSLPQQYTPANPQSHTQAQPQPQLQHYSQPQPSQPLNPNVLPQAQNPLGHSVTGHHSYPQSQPLQQIQQGTLNHPAAHVHPQGGAHQQSQHPIIVQSQFPQQPHQVRPPHSHAPILNQQQPAGQVPNIPPSQQPLVQPHSQQPGHAIQQRSVMQSVSQPMPQQYLQHQPSPFAGQPSVPVQNPLIHQSPLMQQQMPVQSQLRPPHSFQHHTNVFPQPQQNVGLSQGMQPHQSQNVGGRPVVPNHGLQSQPYQQSAGVQGRLMQLGANQNNMIGYNNQGQFTEQQSATSRQPLLADREAEPSSQRAGRKDAFSGVVTDAGEIKPLKSETEMKLINEHRSVDEVEDKTIQTDASSKDNQESMRTATDSELRVVDDGESVVKQIVNEEAAESSLDPSNGGKSGVVFEDLKNGSVAAPLTAEQSAVDSKMQDGPRPKYPPLQGAERLEEQSGKLKDAMHASEVLQISSGSDTGSQAPVPNNYSQNAVLKGALPGSERKVLQHQDRSLPQSQGAQQVPRVDEYRGFPPPGSSQVQAASFAQHSHLVPVADQGRHQPPIPYGPSSLQQRPPNHTPLSGHQSAQTQGQKHLQQPGKASNQPENFPIQHPGPDSTASFVIGPSHYGPSQGPYNMPLSHAGAPRSQGEPVGGPPPPPGTLHPGAFDSHGVMMARALPHGPEGHMGQQRFMNQMEPEVFPNQRPGYSDGGRPDPHLLGSNRGPSRQPHGVHSRMNGAPGADSPSALGLRDERFKSLPDDHLNPFPVDPTRRIIDREFEEDLKRFPRPSHLDYGNYLSSSRPLDRSAIGIVMDVGQRTLEKGPLNYDTGLKVDSGSSAAPSRFMHPYHRGGPLHPNDASERPIGFLEDTTERPNSVLTHPDIRGPATVHGRRHMDGLMPRSPRRGYPGMSSRGFGGPPGVPGAQSGLDDIDSRGPRGFADPIGSSFHEGRFPVMPSHLHRGEFEGPGNLRMGEHIRNGEFIGQDVMPSHLRRGEYLGPRQLRLGEPGGFGAFPGQGQMGELTGPGNFHPHSGSGESFGGSRLSNPRLGEPGFRSSFSLQGFHNDGGIFSGDMEPFDNSRKKKSGSTGWCRICKVDCETVEGLDVHSQTREHQKMAMDMVRSIKQKNSKKQKTISSDHSSLEDANKSKNASFESRGK